MTGIVTVTLNPAVDRTILLDMLVPGSVNRATRSHQRAGGKGINLSSMLGGFGVATTATGFLGGENPHLFEQLFHERNITDECVRIAGETRTNIKMVDASSRETTDINLPGATVSDQEIAMLEAKLTRIATPGTWVIVAGSLPPGYHVEDFSRLLDQLQQQGANIGIDTSGPALRMALKHGVNLVKPNHHELEEALRVSLPDLDSRVSAAIRLQQEIDHVVLSLGPDGAVFIAPDGAVFTPAPEVLPSCTTGAGDALLAGYLAGLTLGLDVAGRSRLAIVFARSALTSDTFIPPAAHEVKSRMEHVAVIPLNPPRLPR